MSLVEELQRENAKLRSEVAECRAAIADRDAKIAKLSNDVTTLQALATRLLANRRGVDKLAEGQGLLFPAAAITIDPPASESAAAATNGQTEAAAKQSSSQKRSPRKPRRIDTTGLPTEDWLHELPEDQRVCPKTGQALVPVGEKVSEELDFKRAQLIVIRHRQVIYGLPPEQAEQRQVVPVLAEMPPRAIENCVASAMLLAWLLVQKYANHLPLYRQEEIFGRDGLRLPRQTLCDWVLAAAEALRPIADCLIARIRAGPVMQLDDTPVMCQGGKGEPNF